MGKRDSATRPVWGYVAPIASPGRKLDELERIIPESLMKSALISAGSQELIFPYAEALGVVALAVQHQIAVLGVEAFEVRKDGAVLALDCSGYEFPLAGDWEAFVTVNNSSAERWVHRHRLGENHGYILTSASEKEFAGLPRQLGPSQKK